MLEPADRERAARLTTLVVAGVAIIISACFAVGFWPGMMSSDSLDQYSQGLTGEYNNRHPPFGSFLLGGTGRLFGTPGPLFIVQLAVIVATFLLLVYRAASSGRPRLVGWWSLAAIVCPDLWFIANCLWKDIWFGGALLVAVVCAQRRQFAGVIAASVVATLLRHNGIVAAVPLVVYAVFSMTANRWRRALICAGIILGLVATPRIVDRIFSPEDVWPLAVTTAYDVVGMLAADEALYDESPARSFASRADLRHQFRLCDPMRIYVHMDAFRPAELVKSRDVLEAAWRQAIVERPLLYLSLRFKTFAGSLGLRRDVRVIEVQDESRENDWVSWDTDALLYRVLMWVRSWSPFPPPWAWCAMVLVLGCVSLIRRHWLALAVTASGLLYALSFFPATASAEMRYFFWDVLIVLIVPLLLLTSDTFRPTPRSSDASRELTSAP